MKRFLVTCAYDGSNFAGWQKQKNKRCVQSEIENAISVFDTRDYRIVGSGRTDAKVHALGQRFHWDTEISIDGNQTVKAINAHLPEDIRIVEALEVPLTVHARFSAIGKCYRYLINNGTYDIFARNYQGFVREKLDIEKMRNASTVFCGEHDFTSFCATTLLEKENQIREITSITIDKTDDLITLQFDGNGFLRYMVRMITQTLIEVGKGKLTEKDVETMLRAKNKKACRYNARPEGLYLVGIEYGEY